MARPNRLELAPDKAKTRLAAWLSQHFFVRFHLSLILGFSLAAGVLTTKGFLALGLHTMHWRWPLALLVSYLAFLLGVRVWLAYVGIGRFLDGRGKGGNDVLDVVGGDGSSSGGGGSFGSGGQGGFSAGGGRFGGGGASGDFSSAAEGDSNMALPFSGQSVASSGGGGGSGSSSGIGKLFGGGGGGGGGGDGDLGEGILVVLAIVALLAVVFGAGIYLIWQAPAVLAEAAFQGALAGGLVKSVRRVNDPGWVGGAVRASALPFIVIFACAMTIAGLAEHYAPAARTLPEAIRLLLS
jgi:hypothetical protein